MGYEESHLSKNLKESLLVYSNAFKRGDVKLVIKKKNGTKNGVRNLSVIIIIVMIIAVLTIISGM